MRSIAVIFTVLLILLVRAPARCADTNILTIQAGDARAGAVFFVDECGTRLRNQIAAFLMLENCEMPDSMPLLPAEHRAFYGQVVQRLVEAGELPSESTIQFNRCFAPAFSATRTSSTS